MYFIFYFQMPEFFMPELLIKELRVLYFPSRGFHYIWFFSSAGLGKWRKILFFFSLLFEFYFNANLPKNILFKYTQNSIQDKICWQRKTNNVCLTLSGRIAENKDESSTGYVNKVESFIGAVTRCTEFNEGGNSRYIHWIQEWFFINLKNISIIHQEIMVYFYFDLISFYIMLYYF